jgi:iron-sulfur cluster assembly accessory protein
MIRRFFASTNKISTNKISTNKFPIKITNPAFKKMSEIVNSDTASCFLFSASSGGCNGFNYDLKLIDENQLTYLQGKHKNKLTLIQQDGAKLVVDPLSEMFLIGTTIDYISENYAEGIFENKFIFIPNKTLASSCGCGISFTPK